MVKHLRRVMANRSECDDDDHRDFADDVAGATCTACRLAYERRAAEWHAEMRERLDKEEDTSPGKRSRGKK